jgi:hypothetical protein
VVAVFNAITINVDIERPLTKVYEFLAEPLNFPSWATGVGDSFEHQSGNDWVSNTPTGRIVFRFAERNRFGILDVITMPEGGEPIYVPVRVVANGEGTQIILTLLQRPGMSDEHLQSDAEWTRSNLQALKSLLENR